MPVAVDDAEVVYILVKTIRELMEMLREEKKHRRSRRHVKKTKRSHHKKKSHKKRPMRAKSVFLLGEEIIA